MIKLKFSLSFFVFSAFLLIFVSPVMLFVYFASLILHEYAHSVVASLFNSKLDTVKLFPYGATIFGNLNKLSPVEEVIVSLAGAVFNAFISLIFIATWWVVPETYNYTEILVTANISLCLFNLLPVYPLDGGQAFFTLLRTKISEKTALKIVKFLGYILSFVLFVAFLFTLFLSTTNYTFLVISLLLFWTALEKKSTLWEKKVANYSLCADDFSRGKTICSIAVLDDFTLEKINKLLHPDRFYQLYIFDKNLHLKSTISQPFFHKILTKYSPCEKICNCNLDKSFNE